ncbi:putative encoded peptide [Helianthus anomalus]
MARLMGRNILCCVFILLFVTIEVTQTSEARILAEYDGCTKKCPERKQVTEDNGATNPSQVPSPSGVDAFRPTTPGHSPGVGHSVHN